MVKGATSEAGKSLIRAAKVWWRCAHYVVIASSNRCLEIIDVCIWRMFVFNVCCSDGGNVCCVEAVVKNSVFLVLEC